MSTPEAEIPGATDPNEDRLRDEIARIQSYLREAVCRDHETVSVPPFTLFINPRDPFRFYNYAIPDEPVTSADGLAGPLAALRQEFRRRERVPRFEFYEAFAPALPEALRAAGFVEEGRQWSMLCRPEDLRPTPPVTGLEMTPIDGDSSDDDLLAFIVAQREGFDPDTAAEVTAQDIEQTRAMFQGGWRGFAGRIGGQPAGVAAFGLPIDGVSEVAGVATRTAFRRRGIGTLLTEAAARAAFDQGANTACLVAADEAAGAIYEKVGFRAFSIMLAYIDAENAA